MNREETLESRAARMGLDLSLSSGDVVLFSYLRAEGLRAAAAVGHRHLGDVVLIVVRGDPKQQREFLDELARKHGPDYASSVDCYGRQHGVLCWPMRRAAMMRSWAASDDPEVRAMTDLIREPPPTGSVYAVICGLLDGEEVTVVMPVRVLMSPAEAAPETPA